jgi:serine protease Do
MLADTQSELAFANRIVRTPAGRIALTTVGVLTLLAIGYFSALVVHWHGRSHQDKESGPMVSFVEETEDRQPETLPSSPKSLDDLRRIQDQLVGSIEKTSIATVAISFASRHGSGLVGSGIVVTEDGYVLTAGHVSAGVDRPVTVTFPNGDTFNGETLGMSMASDTGMVKITEKGPFPFVLLAEAGDIEIGQWCYALGFPGGFDPERGAVARIGRLIGRSRSTIRTDCKLAGGDSGGPLFNLRGELIGIHSRISDSSDENYHAPISAFHRGWEDLKDKQVTHFWEERNGGFLGITDSSSLEDDAGLLILKIMPLTAAAESGLEPGDIITNVNGEKVIDRLEYSAAIEGHHPGDIVEIRFRRGRQSATINVELGLKPDFVR